MRVYRNATKRPNSPPRFQSVSSIDLVHARRDGQLCVMFQDGRACVSRSFLGRLWRSVGVTVLLEAQHSSQYSKESQTPVLGRNFLSFALQFTGANVSFP